MSGITIKSTQVKFSKEHQITFWHLERQICAHNFFNYCRPTTQVSQNGLLTPQEAYLDLKFFLKLYSLNFQDSYKTAVNEFKHSGMLITK